MLPEAVLHLEIQKETLPPHSTPYNSYARTYNTGSYNTTVLVLLVYSIIHLVVLNEG
jgi:hypothetical protein